MVREGLSEAKTWELGQDDGKKVMQRSVDGVSKSKSKCKGPEMGLFLLCSANID